VIAVLPTDPAGWGAFLSGVGSVLAVLLSLKRTRKRAEDKCQQRIDDIRKAFNYGTEFERRQEERKRASG